MKSEERTGRLFVLALFSLSASFLELVDLGFDQLSKKLQGGAGLQHSYQTLCVIETIVGIVAIVMITYSLDRMLVSLRLIASEYKATIL